MCAHIKKYKSLSMIKSHSAILSLIHSLSLSNTHMSTGNKKKTEKLDFFFFYLSVLAVSSSLSFFCPFEHRINSTASWCATLQTNNKICSTFSFLYYLCDCLLRRLVWWLLSYEFKLCLPEILKFSSSFFFLNLRINFFFKSLI